MTRPVSEEAAVLSRAVVKAAHHLGIDLRSLGKVLGLSPSTISRMRGRDFVLRPDSKPFELAILLVRLFVALDLITGGDEALAREWMRRSNSALLAKPIDRIDKITGLVEVLEYLESRQAL